MRMSENHLIPTSLDLDIQVEAFLRRPHHRLRHHHLKITRQKPKQPKTRAGIIAENRPRQTFKVVIEHTGFCSKEGKFRYLFKSKAT